MIILLPLQVWNMVEVIVIVIPLCTYLHLIPLDFYGQRNREQVNRPATQWLITIVCGKLGENGV